MQTISADELDVSCLAVANVAGEFRRRVEYRLAAWGLAAMTDDACLVTAELVANACDATPGERIRFRFTREHRSVVIGVWDSSDLLPEDRPTPVPEPAGLDLSPEGFDDNGGWGLPLVRAIAVECGVCRTTPHGKWVWARLGARR